ncbi:MAG: carbohydrate kinase family protein [Acidobacteriota bacterium]
MSTDDRTRTDDATPTQPDAPASPEVVVVGNIGIDTVVRLAPGDDPRNPEVEGHFTRNRDHIGQAGGYAARGYAALGCRTAFVGAVGDDVHGRWIRGVLAADGIDARGVFVDPAGTCRSVNLMGREGQRRFFYDPKGHMTLPVDLDRVRAVARGARLAHVHLPNWARRVLPVLRELGVFVAVDLQDMRTVDDAYRDDFLQHADLAFVSASVHVEPLAFLAALRARWPDLPFVMGMGARGAALAWPGAAVLRMPPPAAPDDAAPLVDTNGAGDALAVATLVAHVLDDRPPIEALLRGQIAARHACGLDATSDGLITRDALEQRARASAG